MPRRRPRLSSYERAGRRSRAQVLAVQADAERQLAEEYAAMRKRLQPHLDALTAAYATELARVQAEQQTSMVNGAENMSPDIHKATVPPLWINKLTGGNWPMLSVLIGHEARQFGQAAQTIIRRAMAQTAEIGADGAQEMLRAAIAPIAHLLPGNGDIFTRPK
jgi:hypothetical protein